MHTLKVDFHSYMRIIQFRILGQYFSSIKELPETLFSDIALSLKEDLITKSNLLNFGTPNFVFAMAKYNFHQTLNIFTNF
mgnify:CR=1 FL=1